MAWRPAALRRAPLAETPPAPGKAAGAYGAMLCVDAATGKVRWEAGGPDLSLGGGQWSYVAPVVGSGVVCVLDGRGALRLFAAADGKRVGKGPLPVDTLRCTSIAVAANAVVTRGWKSVVCYRARKTQTQP